MSALDKPIIDGRQARAAFNADPRIVEIRVYDAGFVPASYRWPAPATGRVYTMKNGRVVCSTFTYDRKRSHGRGPDWVALSARGGRLASY